MAFGDRIKARREELALSRPQLADRLGVTPSTVSNYETGVSFPKEEMMLRLFDCLETDPNTLFQDSFRRGADFLTVTPGIRFADSAAGDQKRIMTPEKAGKSGCDYIVVGRPITQAEDPVAAYRRAVKDFWG